MDLFQEYLNEIVIRKQNGLHPKPINQSNLTIQIINQILEKNNKYRKESLNFLVYNILPGTTPAAEVKAKFLEKIILEEYRIPEINPNFAFKMLSHMKGGPSIKILINLLLGSNEKKSKKALDVLKTQVFLYDADISRIEIAFKNGNTLAKELLQSYSQAEFFTKLPDIDEKIEIVTFVAGVGDISTDLLSPGSDAHSRADRELHGKSIFEHNKEQQKELLDLQKKHPDKKNHASCRQRYNGCGFLKNVRS